MPRDKRDRILAICGNFLSDPENQSQFETLSIVVYTFQAGQSLLYCDMNFALFHGSAEINVRQRCRVLFTLLFREGEYNDREQYLLLQVVYQMDVQVLVCTRVDDT